MQKLLNEITKDMTIEEILDRYSNKAIKLSEIMTEAGLHCVGCGAAKFETLEQGVLGHGFSEAKLNKLVNDLNAVLDEEEEEVSLDSGSLLKLTSSAVKKVNEIMIAEKKKGHGLRVAVLSGGCAGYSYDLSVQKEGKNDDMVIEQDGIKIFVAKESAEMLEGIEIEYVDTLNESGFKFNNPNAKHGCGCGKSFN